MSSRRRGRGGGRPSISNGVTDRSLGRRKAADHHERAVVGERLPLRVLPSPSQGLFDVRRHLSDLSPRNSFSRGNPNRRRRGCLRPRGLRRVQAEEVPGGSVKRRNVRLPGRERAAARGRRVPHRPVALQEDFPGLWPASCTRLHRRGIEKNEEERDEAVTPVRRESLRRRPVIWATRDRTRRRPGGTTPGGTPSGARVPRLAAHVGIAA